MRSSEKKLEIKFVPQCRQGTDQELIDDLRWVGRQMNARTLSRHEYRMRGRFGDATIFRRFGSWNQALKKAGLEPSRYQGTPANEVIRDLRRVARKLKVTRLTIAQYCAEGLYSPRMIYYRFGSWAQAVVVAGLEPSRHVPTATATALLENLYQLWRHYGRQPKCSDLKPPLSVFSLRPYGRCFGGFENALRALEQWAQRKTAAGISTHKTSRAVNPQLRYRVLSRDNFKCRSCGRSPASDETVKLQVDHVVPWSAGGETVEENLRTLCQNCNAGKSDHRPQRS